MLQHRQQHDVFLQQSWAQRSGYTMQVCMLHSVHRVGHGIVYDMFNSSENCWLEADVQVATAIKQVQCKLHAWTCM